MLDYFLVSKKKIQFNICLYYDSHLRNVKTRDHHSNREEDGHLHWNTTTTLYLGCMLRNNSTDSTEKLLSTRRKRCLRSFIQKTDPQLKLTQQEGARFTVTTVKSPPGELSGKK